MFRLLESGLSGVCSWFGLHSWAIHFTLTMAFSIQVYEMHTGPILMHRLTLQWTSIPSRVIRNITGLFSYSWNCRFASAWLTIKLKCRFYLVPTYYLPAFLQNSLESLQDVVLLQSILNVKCPRNCLGRAWNHLLFPALSFIFYLILKMSMSAATHPGWPLHMTCLLTSPVLLKCTWPPSHLHRERHDM